jgi:transcriptional regulator with XRE-family HTH domain
MGDCMTIQKMKKFIKKVVVTDNKSLPEERGRRLKQLRNLANLNRKQLCEHSGINIHSLKGWEIGRYGGLPLDGAEKVIKRVAQEGVSCPLEWLLYEIGTGPQVVVDFYKTKEEMAAAESELKIEDETQLICKELMLFRKLFRHTIELRIGDDGMNPLYNVGDYVAGQKIHGDRIKNALGHDCIIQTHEGKIFFRKLREGTEADRYTLMCTNLQTQVAEPIIYNVRVANVAPVIRHYKKRV